MMRRLTCCCCGGDAGRFQQWWNRDKGFGICARCVAQERKRHAADVIQLSYGVEGIHYAARSLKSCDICDRMQPELHYHEWSIEGGNSNFPCDTSYCCICRGCDPDECDILIEMHEEREARRAVALVVPELHRSAVLWALGVRLDAADAAIYRELGQFQRLQR